MNYEENIGLVLFGVIVIGIVVIFGLFKFAAWLLLKKAARKIEDEEK